MNLRFLNWLTNASLLAPNAFSTSSTYDEGDYCIYNNTLYKCTTAITTAGAWDASNWTATQIGDEFSELNSNLTNLGNTYTGSWTASSSSANQTQLTEKKRVNKGTYLVIGSTPACSVANLFMQMAWQKGSGTVNTTGFNYSRDFSHFSYVITITEDDTDVWVRSASSTSCTFSNTGYGWFKLIRIK